MRALFAALAASCAPIKPLLVALLALAVLLLLITATGGCATTQPDAPPPVRFSRSL